MLERIAEEAAGWVGYRFAALAVAAVVGVVLLVVAWVIGLWSDLLGAQALSTFGIALLVFGAIYVRLITRK
jgi:hypothetical protein